MEEPLFDIVKESQAFISYVEAKTSLDKLQERNKHFGQSKCQWSKRQFNHFTSVAPIQIVCYFCRAPAT